MCAPTVIGALTCQERAAWRRHQRAARGGRSSRSRGGNGCSSLTAAPRGSGSTETLGRAAVRSAALSQYHVQSRLQALMWSLLPGHSKLHLQDSCFDGSLHQIPSRSQWLCKNIHNLQSVCARVREGRGEDSERDGEMFRSPCKHPAEPPLLV